ncbi:MAG: hypothetical protein CG441_1254 [Methylococcaceae bacterium NSM2-1]|nr:MAG: hypothetical protein CG441_1254 [Methylococcaceae bacterium NSM2-1]
MESTRAWADYSDTEANATPAGIKLDIAIPKNLGLS